MSGRTARRPRSPARCARRCRAIDPGVPLTRRATLESEIRTSLWQERLVAILSAFFGVASVVLAAIGLYGALALSVAQRRREWESAWRWGRGSGMLLRTVCSPMARRR